MRVEFEFNQPKVAAHGYRMEQILATLKRVFGEDGFRCTSEEGTIMFEGNGREDDFANMWLSIQDLINSTWFLNCAAACRWYDRSDNGEEEIFEDVLLQAHLLMQKLEG